jgi:hypothetical protein
LASVEQCRGVTFRVVVVGAGPAGFEVASALLADSVLAAEIDLVDRAVLPDGLLRHGPAAGAHRLRDVARDVDTVLSDSRVTYYGGVAVGTALPLDELRSAAGAVVLSTGAPRDLPLEVAGHDSVGVGTVSHVEAWLVGNADVELPELDLAMDTMVLIGSSAETLRVAEVLCGRAPAGVSDHVRCRLAASRLRHVQLIDPRSNSAIGLPRDVPANLIVRTGLTPVGVVGRNRARALRCLHGPDSYGRVVSEDLRAQLLLRPRAESFCWNGVDEDHGHIDHRNGRVLECGTQIAGLYVAGWAGRGPRDRGSHADDASAVVAALHADLPALPGAKIGLGDVLAMHRIEVTRADDWSAVAATDALLARFAGEGMAPLADYDTLVDRVDED